MKISRSEVLDALGRVVTRGIKLTALADDLGLVKADYSALRTIVAELVDDGTVEVLTGGAFALKPHGRPVDRVAEGARRTMAVADKRVQRAKLPWSDQPQPPAQAKPFAFKAPASSPTRSGLRVSGSRPTDRRPPAAGFRSPSPPSPVAPPLSEAVERPTGRITVHPAGYGFVALEGGRDVFVPAKYRGHALDGDRVVLSTWQGVKGTEGRVEEVVARGRARLTGILRRTGRASWLEPDDPRIQADFGRVALDGAPQGEDGDAIVVEITQYPGPGVQLAGRLLKVLGDPEDPRTEIEKLLACAAMPIEFPIEAASQAEHTPQEVSQADFAARVDLRDRRFCTIDPETARDFDDALCIEAGPHGGPRVWVAVADVSHYVRWDDPLDREAQIRGVSVYLPDRVIPMLPHALSSGICSLNPGVDRCAMVVRLDYTDGGDLVDTGYAAAVIQSQARLDYPGVAAALGGDFRGRREMYRPWVDELTRLQKLSQVLRTRRKGRGALDLDLPEAKVVLDADDPRLVRDVVRAKGDPGVKQAYELVEEFMIAANEAVGAYFRRRGAPTVWRVHAPPRRERVEELSELLGAYNIRVDVDEAMTPAGMKWVLGKIAELPAARALSFLVLRSLTQAVWDTVPIGHFGLASGDYLHFTSPIRRYPDLLVHRLLKFHLHREGQPGGVGYRGEPPTVERLAELASASSGHERRAMEAEREAVAMYRAYLMRDQVGERFTGTITAVTHFGVFVEIDEPFVEGLVKVDSLGHGFVFDGAHMTLSNPKNGRSLGLGETIQVEIAEVSVLRRRIELTLVSGGGRAAARPAPSAEPSRVGIADRRRASRAVERAAVEAQERHGKRRGRPGLKVSHRQTVDDDGGPRRRRRR